MSKVVDRIRDGALTAAGVALLAAAPVAGLRDHESVLLVLGLTAAGIGLVALGIFEHLPGGAGRAVTIVGAGAFAVFYLVTAIASVLFPDAMVGTGPRAPHTPGAARLRGFVLLGIPFLAGLVVLVASRRRPRD